VATLNKKKIIFFFYKLKNKRAEQVLPVCGGSNQWEGEGGGERAWEGEYSANTVYTCL
jgi:hypothetical protein